MRRNSPSFLLTAFVLVGLLSVSCVSVGNRDSHSGGSKNPQGVNVFLNSLEYPYQEGYLVVGFRDRNALSRIQSILSARLVEIDDELDFALLELRTTVRDAYSKLSAISLDGIDYVEPRYVRSIPVIREESLNNISWNSSVKTSSEGSSETYWKYLWGLQVTNVRSAWANGFTGEGVTVAVLDTGIDGTHPDLSGNVVRGFEASNNLEIGPGTDSSIGGAHGTHVAGTIAAQRDGRGVVGVAPGARLMPVVIFASWYVGDDKAATAIRWAVDNGARVLNNSWGGLGYSMTLKRAIDYALERGVVVVAAAGNSTIYQSSMYPANYPGVVQVGALEYGDPPRTTSFSNRSPLISVGAPGRLVLSTVPMPGSKGYEREKFKLPENGATYGFMSGTSMATPHVSGFAALVLQKHPTAKPWQVRKLLENSAVDIDERGVDQNSGFGLVNASALNGELPAIGGADLVLRLFKGSERPTGLTVSLVGRSTSGRYVRYFALSDAGVAKFLSIDAGSYEITIGGPNTYKRLTLELSTDTTLDVEL